eukprot:SAG31_NODE_816_length_11865_cov_38.805116_1_plen_130_part_00
MATTATVQQHRLLLLLLLLIRGRCSSAAAHLPPPSSVALECRTVWGGAHEPAPPARRRLRLKVDDEWWTCSGFSAGYADAKFNGTATIPFFGRKDSAKECRAACEADPQCNAFLWSGPSPHISPTHQNW